MKSIRAAVTFATLAYAINAHAGLFSADGMDKNCLEEHSKAWCVWDAAKMSKDTSDIPQKKFQASYEKQGGNIADIGMALATNQGWLPPTREPLGLGKGVQAGMFLLGFLLQGGTRATSNGNTAIAWMPIEMASTEEEARRKLNELMLNAAAQSMPGYKLTPGIFPLFSDAYTSLNGIFDSGWSVTGKDCDSVTCRLIPIRGASNFLDGEFYTRRTPNKGEAPKWMGGYKAWVFDFHHSGVVPDLMVGEKDSMTYKIAKVLSQRLPDWAFLSISDQTKEYRGKVINRGVTLPLIVNKGNFYAPIFPEVDLNSPDTQSPAGRNSQ